MLLETIPYESNLPIEITVCNIKEYPVHYHHALEIAFLLKGSAIMKVGCTTDTLSAGDICTVAPNSVHGIRGLTEDSIFAVLHINNDFLTSHFPDSIPATYHTHLEDPNDPDLGWLREQLLQLISAYFQREEGYLDNCTRLCQQILTLIDQRFVLFSIGDEEIKDFDRDNEKTVARMLRVFRFIQENLEGPVSLAELAEQENLSTFYLSHMIKDCSGLSFRDLVSFLRTEKSEIDLLEGEEKISRIAKACGFSTSKYYEQAFLRWYHSTPEQHIATYRHMRLDITNLPRVEFLSMEELRDTVSQVAFQVVSQNRMVSSASTQPQVLRCGPQTQTIKHLESRLTITLTVEDLKQMGAMSGGALQCLSCSRIVLYKRPQDTPEEIERFTKLILATGQPVTVVEKDYRPRENHYGYDTLAGPINFLIELIFNGDGQFTYPLRDQTRGSDIITGGKGIYAPICVHKPLYDAMFVTGSSAGSLKLRGSNYALIQREGNDNSLLLIAFNYNDEILRLCHEENTPQEADDTIKSFRDVLNLRFRLSLPSGHYTMGRYTFTHHSTMFNLLSELDFRAQGQLTRRLCHNYLFSPHAEGRLVTVEDSLDVDVTLRGLSIQFILLHPEA